MADGFGVFTAGRIGQRAIESDRFNREEALRSRSLDIQEQGQQQQLALQEQQLGLQQQQIDLSTEAGRRRAGLERINLLVELEASRRLLLENGQEDPGLGNFLDTQGGLDYAKKWAKLNDDQVELMVLREKEKQRRAQEDASTQALGTNQRLVRTDPATGQPTEIFPAAAKESDITVLERERASAIATGDDRAALARTNMIAKITGQQAGSENRALFEGDGGLTVPATNSLRNETASLFGGVYDPVSGRVTGIEKESAPRMTAINARAADLLLNDDANTIPRAVAMAAAEFGVDIPPSDVRKEKILEDAVIRWKQLSDEGSRQVIIERLEKMYGISRDEFEEALR